MILLKILKIKKKKNFIKSIYTLNKEIQKYDLKKDITELETIDTLNIFKSINYPHKIALQRSITTGIQIDNIIEIVDGLEANEKIVVRGQSLLENNSKIKVISQIQPLSVNDSAE